MSTNDVTLRVRQTGAEATASDLGRLAREVEGLGRMRARPTIDPRGIDRGTTSLRDATRQSVQLGRGFETAHRGAMLLRGAMVGLAGAQVTRGLWATANAASDLNEAANRAVTVFGRDGVREVQRFAKISAQAFGISRREFLDTAGTFGAMLIPLGILPRKAADMSVAMTKLAGDLSSFHNANPADVLMDLRSGLAGETEPLRKYGISLNEARLQQEALRLGLSDGKKTLDSHAKAMAAYSLIMSDAKKTGAVGDFARTQGQLANQLRVAKAAANDAAVGFGKVMLPTIRSGVRVLTREVLPQVQAFGESVAKVFAREDLSPAEKWSQSWAMLKDTGLPEAAKEAIYQGMVEVGTNAPRMMLRAMAEAPWPAKAILGAMLVRRFGPVFSLLGSRAVTALGGSKGGGGALAGGIGGPVPVVVTNPGFGIGGGKGGAIPGGLGMPYPGAPTTVGNAGRVSRYGRSAMRYGSSAAGMALIAVPAGMAAGAGARSGSRYLGLNEGASNVLAGAGQGAVSGAMVGSVAGPPGIVVGAAVGAVGGAVWQTLFGKKTAEWERAAAAAGDTLGRSMGKHAADQLGDVLAASAKARSELAEKIEANSAVAGKWGTRNTTPTGAARREVARADEALGRRAGAVFAGVLEGGTRFKTARGVTSDITRVFDDLPKAARKSAAGAVLAQVNELRKGGRLSAAEANKVIANLRERYAVLEDVLPKAGKKAADGLALELRARGPVRSANRMIADIEQTFDLGINMVGANSQNLMSQWGEMWGRLNTASRTGSKQQRAVAKEMRGDVEASIRGSLRNLDKMADGYGTLSRRSKVAVRAQIDSLDELAQRVKKGGDPKLARDITAAMEILRRKLSDVTSKLADVRTGAQIAADSVRKVSGGTDDRTVGKWGQSRGGWIPGNYTGVDTQLVWMAAGERVLPPYMVNAIDRKAGIPGLVDSTISRMGGKMGGSAFAKGGWVFPVAGSTKVIGTPGSGTHSYSENGSKWYDDTAYDFGAPEDAKVLAPTAGTLGRVSGGNMKSGRYYGYGIHLYVKGGGEFFLKHLKTLTRKSGAVKAGDVIGTLGGTGILNGGPHLHIGATSLSLLNAARGGGRGTGNDDGSDDAHGKESERTDMDNMLAFTRAGGLANRRNIGARTERKVTPKNFGNFDASGAATDARPGIARSSGVSVARDLMTDTPDLSGSIDTSPGGRASLGIKRAGSEAAARARAAGKSPEQVAADRKKAEDDELRKFYRRQRATTVKRVRQAQAEIKRLTRIIRSLTKSKNGTKAGRARLIRALRVEVRDWRTELGEVLDVLAQIDEALLDLDDAATDEAYSASKLDTDGDGVPDSQDTDPAGTSTTDNSAATDAAEERAAAAEAREQVFKGRSDASGQILKGITGSSSIDPGAGSVAITVNVGGSLVTQNEVGGWLVGILGNGPGSRRGSIQVGG